MSRESSSHKTSFLSLKPRPRLKLRLVYYLGILSLCLLLLTIPYRTKLNAQVPAGPVTDVGVVVPNGLILSAKILMRRALEDNKEFIGLIKDVGEFFQKANQVVNRSFENMRMVKEVVEDYQQILDMYNQALADINDLSLSANNVDEVEELVLDKLKHTKILAAILKETENSFELFTELIQEDLQMDDKGRIRLIQKTHYTLKKTKKALRLSIRNINREIIQYRKNLQELKGFEALFGYN